jgi:hypothetical protein
LEEALENRPIGLLAAQSLRVERCFEALQDPVLFQPGAELAVPVGQDELTKTMVIVEERQCFRGSCNEPPLSRNSSSVPPQSKTNALTIRWVPLIAPDIEGCGRA